MVINLPEELNKNGIAWDDIYHTLYRAKMILRDEGWTRGTYSRRGRYDVLGAIWKAATGTEPTEPNHVYDTMSLDGPSLLHKKIALYSAGLYLRHLPEGVSIEQFNDTQKSKRGVIDIIDQILLVNTGYVLAY